MLGPTFPQGQITGHAWPLHLYTEATRKGFNPLCIYAAALSFLTWVSRLEKPQGSPSLTLLSASHSSKAAQALCAAKRNRQLLAGKLWPHLGPPPI
jgi:hypothetical protein